jgi:hypothetical protein
MFKKIWLSIKLLFECPFKKDLRERIEARRVEELYTDEHTQ